MSVQTRLQDIFRLVLADESIDLNDAMTAADREDWDSVANLNLMFMVEQEFGVSFKGSEFNRFRNVGELRERLETLIA